MNSATSSPPKELLSSWCNSMYEFESYHRLATHVHFRNHYLLGVPVVILSAVVGTSVFASLTIESPTVQATIAVGMISVVAAVLASLQTFLSYAERAEKHRAATARYGAIRRQIEQLISNVKNGEVPSDGIIDNLRTQIDNLAAEAPHINPGIHRKMLRKLEHKRISEDK